MNRTAAADVVIFGGGIAGLWLLNRLRKQGFSALLFESHSLGGGQTHKAQGIIHGGMKYALQGVLTGDAKAMADMPSVWKACLSGEGELNLSEVPVLSRQHYLWSPHKFTSKLTGFLASATLTSKVAPLKKEAYPLAFQHPQFKGEVFSLDELVVDVPALVRELVKYNQDAIFQIEPLAEEELAFDADGNLQTATVYSAGRAITVSAQHFVFAAGAGNELIVKKLNLPDLKMQRRPLHMVLVKTPFNAPLYAHCLGLGSRPRITVTTHFLQDGQTVWYLGGLLSEEGVGKTSSEQIAAAKAELTSLFPWLNFADAEFATFMIDRAEPLQGNGLKPETSFTRTVKNITIAWPTKLALAPKLATEILKPINELTPQWFDTREMRSWPMPPLARPVWEEHFCKNDA